MRRRQSYRAISSSEPTRQGGLLPIEDYLSYLGSNAWHTDGIVIRECARQIPEATPQEAYLSYASTMLSIASQMSHLHRAAGETPLDDISRRFSMVDEQMARSAVSAMLGPLTDVAADGRCVRMESSRRPKD